MKKHIVIIGGGVIGLSTAFALIQSGHKVTIIEARDEIANETSFANGGQLSYRYVAPLADAGVPIQAIQWLGKSHSPLNFKLNFSPFQWSWLMKFLLACNRKDNILNGNHILRLSLLSQQVMSNWKSQIEDFYWEKSGKLVIHRHEKSFSKARESIDTNFQQFLSVKETLEIEPSLFELKNQLVGSIFTPNDETADCYKFCLALLKKLNTSFDFECLYQRNVINFNINNNEIVSIETNRGLITADEYVIAAGNGSTYLFEKVGISVPIYPLKGYSLTLPFPKDINIVPNISVTDYNNKIVYAKLGNQLRIAAMVDLGYESISIREERVKALKQHIKNTFPKLKGLEDALEWTGSRPSTPKGPPILGRTKYKNLWANVGHGSLGFTLAAGSALVVSQLINQSSSPIDLDGLSMEIHS